MARGEYLTRAADSHGLSHRTGGQPFAGGCAFTLPFGTMYSTNITADKETGIGTGAMPVHRSRAGRGCRA